MPNREQQLILDLVAHRKSQDEFLREFGIARTEASELSLRMLEDACRHRNQDDVDYGLLVGFVFGFSQEFVPTLIQLSDEDWHHSHEDVVLALDKLRDTRAIDALYRAALKHHPYLEYDEGRALAGKAVRALSRIGDPVADEKLKLLATSEDTSAKRHAIKELRRRETVSNQAGS